MGEGKLTRPVGHFQEIVREWQAARKAFLSLETNDVRYSAEAKAALERLSKAENNLALAALPSGAEPVAPEGWVLVPQKPDDRMLQAGRDANDPDRFFSAKDVYDAMLAAVPASPSSSPVSGGVRVKPTFAELKRDAENAVDALAAYAYNNEALEDACSESAKVMVAATWNRVKAEQALAAIRDITFKSAPALSAIGEHP